MASGRRSTRSQLKRTRNPGDNEDYQPVDVPQGQREMNPEVGMDMMMGQMMLPGSAGWPMGVGMGYQAPTEGFLGYQYQHNMGSYPPGQYPHGQYPHGQYPHGQYQYPQHYTHGHQQYQHHPVVDTHGAVEEEPVPGTSRNLRARTSGGNTGTVPAGRNRKGPIASAAAGASTSGTQGKVSGDDDSDNVDGEEAATTTKKAPHGMVHNTLTVDQMVQNCLFYMLLQQHKRIPVKRSDLIKNAMNSQHKQFSEVMKKLESTLADVFGVELVRIGKGKDNLPCVATGSIDGSNAAAEEEVEEQGVAGKKNKGKAVGNASATYILVSKYPSSVFDSSMFIMARRDPEADSKKTVLYLVLSTIFMLNRPIDEELIWKIITDMQFSKMVCERRDEMRKFLKSEFVSPGYLNMETFENQSHSNAAKHSAKDGNSEDAGDTPKDLSDNTTAKYSWGPRAHKEYSKYAMLKFVTARFAGRKMYEFTVQYNMVQRSPDIIDRDVFGDRDSDGENLPSTSAAALAAQNGSNGSALKIKKKGAGTGETFSIDGENTETETEGAE